MVTVDDDPSTDRPRAEWRRTLAAFVSAMIVSGVVWAAVVLFDVR